MKLKITNLENLDSGNESSSNSIDVADKIFKYPFNKSLIHQVVSSYLTNGRQGSKSQKNRSEVSGSTRKPWRQKGTGRARSGSVKSPIWRSGGVTFAAKPKEHHQKINKKMYRGAIKSILSQLICDNRLFFIEDFFLPVPKTKLFLEKIKKIALDKSVLILVKDIDKNIFLSSKNLYQISIRDLSRLDPISLINSEVTLITKSAVCKLEQKLI